MFAYSKLFSCKIIYLAKKVNIWIESFGDFQNPAILLIIGAGSQCILWPDEFCKQLAAKGFFVIRYDHRDTGKSCAIDYKESPYTIMDLTQDAIAVLESFHIKTAHIVGFSMGGQIAQFIGAYYPEYAQSITLMATSTSFKEGFDAFKGESTPGGLSQPKDYYVKWATRVVDVDKQSNEERIQDFLTSWQLLNGNNATFDDKLYNEIAKESFTRSTLYNPYLNHALAMQASYEEHSKAPGLINAPTLIIHGKEDPVFGIDHAHALNKAIANSELVIIDDMGHNLNTPFFKKLINLIKGNTNKNLVDQTMRHEMDGKIGKICFNSAY